MLEQIPSLEVVLTRNAGTSASQEQCAQIANRLKADLYIHLSFFQETDVKPRLFLYTFSYNNDFPLKDTPFCFISYDQAHCLFLETSMQYARAIQQALAHCAYNVQTPMAIPYTPLKGIACPAVGIEIG